MSSRPEWRAILLELEAKYRLNANPVHAWKAFAVARHAKMDPPDWSLDYLEKNANRILKMCDDIAKGGVVKREAERVGKALGFGADGPGRGKGQFHDAAMLERDRMIYFAVKKEINAGSKPYFAYYDVAKAQSISPATVRRAYIRIKDLNSKSSDEQG